MDKGYESTELCAACGGACCKANGCSLAPEDMLRELEIWRAGMEPGREEDTENPGTVDMGKLEAWLLESDCAVDSFTGQEGLCYYIRMRHKCFTFIGVDAMGECVALTDRGCSLPYERRPKGGRCLEGRQDRHCRQHYTQVQMEADWRPYQRQLREIWDRWHDRLKEEGVFDRCEEDYMRFQRVKRQGAGRITGERKK